MAMHRFEILLNELLDRIFQNMHFPEARSAAVKTFFAVALLFVFLQEVYLRFCHWMRPVLRAVVRWEGDEDALLEGIAEWVVGLIQGYVLAEIVKSMGAGVGWLCARIRRWWTGAV